MAIGKLPGKAVDGGKASPKEGDTLEPLRPSEAKPGEAFRSASEQNSFEARPPGSARSPRERLTAARPADHRTDALPWIPKALGHGVDGQELRGLLWSADDLAHWPAPSQMAIDAFVAQLRTQSFATLKELHTALDAVTRKPETERYAALRDEVAQLMESTGARQQPSSG